MKRKPILLWFISSLFIGVLGGLFIQFTTELEWFYGFIATISIMVYFTIGLWLEALATKKSY